MFTYPKYIVGYEAGPQGVWSTPIGANSAEEAADIWANSIDEKSQTSALAADGLRCWVRCPDGTTQWFTIWAEVSFYAEPTDEPVGR